MKHNRIILLHGFNSGPGKKEEEIKSYLEEHLLEADYELIAPQLLTSSRFFRLFFIILIINLL